MGPLLRPLKYVAVVLGYGVTRTLLLPSAVFRTAMWLHRSGGMFGVFYVPLHLFILFFFHTSLYVKGFPFFSPIYL